MKLPAILIAAALLQCCAYSKQVPKSFALHKMEDDSAGEQFGVKKKLPYFRDTGELAVEFFKLMADMPAILGVYLSKDSISPQMREKVMLAVTTGNKCKACYSIHSGLGRALGIAEEDMGKLEKDELDPADFPPGEWVVMKYARDYAIFGEESPDEELVGNFRKSCTEKSAGEIRTCIKAIDFTNRFNNSFDIERESLERRKRDCGF
jgi:AhpD family alkylhydroperoxidase